MVPTVLVVLDDNLLGREIMVQRKKVPDMVLRPGQHVEVLLWEDQSISFADGVILGVNNKRPRSLIVLAQSNTPFARPGDQLVFEEWVRKSGSMFERGYSLEERVLGDSGEERASMRRLAYVSFQIGVWP